MNRPSRSWPTAPAGVDAADPIRQRSFWPAFTELWNSAHRIAQRENFLHWQVAFPGVWRDWQDDRPIGGFDAIIGNPPWDRIKLQEVEWFATRCSPNWPSPLPPPPVVAPPSSSCATRTIRWHPNSTPPSCAPTASAS